MSSSTRIISYKATIRVKRNLEKFSDNLKTSKAKIINYAFYELFIKYPDKATPEVIADYISLNTFDLKKSNYTLHILIDYYDRITEIKSKVQTIKNVEYHDNEFIGLLLAFYFDKVSFLRKKKVNEQFKEFKKPSQIGLYLNKDLKGKITELCQDYQLNAGMLLFDILTDTDLGKLPFNSLPKNIVIESEEKERIMVFLPPYIHKQLNELPLSNSFIAEVRSEQYLHKFELKKG
ncbi:hypothetical protein CQ056_25895 [Peribacillus simplex]|uniref:hypothetical protein n=1 Tax=Peribacillus TaxID=2675229 RepID=UPI000D00DD22|nr:MULTISPECIES: hypothetical protein [Peribacillus]MCF7625483.1 hypothetical protein [Peribacillus frigoritolerans]PRA75738.1 hypothetical protein CQ056_25895 [Peribacillus simplex]